MKIQMTQKGDAERDRTVMQTERLTIREMTQSDIDVLCEIMCDEETMMAAYGTPYSVEEVKRWIDRQLKRYEDFGFGLWAVTLKATGKVIGQCGLTYQNWRDRQVLEIGYLFHRSYWHRGYATEAAIACREYAFDVLNVDSVYSIIRDMHTASQGVAVRNGMKIIDRAKKNFRGIEMDFFLYGVDKASRQVTK